jgi:hypothetical protein
MIGMVPYHTVVYDMQCGGEQCNTAKPFAVFRTTREGAQEKHAAHTACFFTPFSCHTYTLVWVPRHSHIFTHNIKKDSNHVNRDFYIIWQEP